jgi:simple sugar transport system permease protein
MSATSAILDATIRTATPLLLASSGELVSEQAGMLNIGLEGCIIAGAYAAYAAGPASLGYPAAVAAGLLLGAVHAAFVIWLRRDQIIVGTALTMLALGATGALFQARAASAVALRNTDPSIAYAGCLVIIAVWFFLTRTHAGLALRSVGDDAEAARSAGVPVTKIRLGAVLFGSAMGGLAGGALVLAQAGAFAEGMSAGRGFLAIAIVALGRWRPWGVASASLLFGAAMALQFVVQALGWNVRYELALMIPYLLTLGALGFFARGSAPAMLGRRIE